LRLAEPSAPDVRVYVVWSLSRPREGIGIYVGVHPDTWGLLIYQSGGQPPLEAGARLRRYPTLDAARAAWLRDAPRRLRPTLPEDPALWLVFR
jgi:hypothetical protein